MSESIETIDDVIDTEELEELLDHAEENLTAVILATAAYTKERQLSFADWVEFVSTRVAPTWDEALGRGPMDVARLAALNVVASGGDVHELSGDEGHARLRCTWPEAEDLEFFGLTREDLDPFFDAYVPVAAHLGLTYQHRRDGDQITMEFTR